MILKRPGQDFRSIEARHGYICLSLWLTKEGVWLVLSSDVHTLKRSACRSVDGADWGRYGAVNLGEGRVVCERSGSRNWLGSGKIEGHRENET